MRRKFLTLPKLRNTICENQFWLLLINLCDNIWECRWIYENVDEYSVFTYYQLFSKNWHMCGSGFTQTSCLWTKCSQVCTQLKIRTWSSLTRKINRILHIQHKKMKIIMTFLSCIDRNSRWFVLRLIFGEQPAKIVTYVKYTKFIASFRTR